MKIVVHGLWHLGCVTAACLAKAGHDVVGVDSDKALVEKLAQGEAPIAEAGLDALIREEIDAGRLRFSSDIAASSRGRPVIWTAFDTPVDGEDRADVPFVLEKVRDAIGVADPGTVILISSQVPAGTARTLQADATRLRPGAEIRIAVSPENLRLGKAIDVFRNPDRVVVGVDDERARKVVGEVFAPISDRIEWMSTASAEMTKHAINSFLAVSVVFMNEIATLCEKFGADAAEVERGLKTESRIGPKAYVKAGAAFAGGTLARDLNFLRDAGRPGSLFDAALESNRMHREWPRRALADALGGVRGKRVAVLGLAYKAGTSTLRRSEGLALAAWLGENGATAVPYDPDVREFPAEAGSPANSIETAVAAADAIAIMNDAPRWKEIRLADLASRRPAPAVVDPNGILAAQPVPKGLAYRRVGATVRS